MIDELKYGTRNKRGDFKPAESLSLPPYVQSPNASGWGAWVKGLIWPWNTLIIGISLLWWFFVVPDMQTMRTLEFGWIAKLFVAKWVALFLYFGFFEYRLFYKKKQAGRFKYNHKFPETNKADYFWFGSQNIDNFLRTMCVSVPICVALEVFIYWAFANGYANAINVADHPIYVGLLVFFTGTIHETYFFFAHWFMHWKPFYNWCHTIHHNSTNPSPWTSMSNHPVETVLQFAPALLYLVVPGAPFLAMHHLNMVAFSSVVGHIGFEKMEFGESMAFDTHAYAHYLHHKLFEVNYCDNGVMAWDKWIGSFHDGTAVGDQLMDIRHQKKVQAANAD